MLFRRKKSFPTEQDEPQGDEEKSFFFKDYSPEEIAYIEQTVEILIENMKLSGVLEPDFKFVTKEEREREANVT